ncbi:MAG: lamin tail domain-containing protein [Myxococcota bacterium]
MRSPFLITMLCSTFAVGCKPDQNFTRIPSPPTVSLSAVEEGPYRQAEGDLAFPGAVSDNFDAPSRIALTWILDGEPLDEPFFDEDGEVLLRLVSETLTPGLFELTLQAIDSDEDRGEATITFELLGPREAPTVRIIDPADESRIDLGSTLTARGEAADSWTDADELSFRWESSIDGALEGSISEGGQSILFAEDLSAGEHRITLTATDADGDHDSDSITLWVDRPLGVSITAPATESVFNLDASIPFEGGLDESVVVDGALRFRWESDVDGVLGEGVVSERDTRLEFDGLQAGSHLITLVATDDLGSLGRDEVVVDIIVGPVDAEPGDLIFSELMINPDAVDDVQGEWFELYNTSGSQIDIQGYTIQDEDFDEWVIDVPMVVPPGEYFVLCANTDAARNGGVETCDAAFVRPQLPPPGLALGNSGDEMILIRPDGEEIDRVEYTSSWVRAGTAIGLDPDHLDNVSNDDRANWCEQSTAIRAGGDDGTPGEENDPC